MSLKLRFFHSREATEAGSNGRKPNAIYFGTTDVNRKALAAGIGRENVPPWLAPGWRHSVQSRWHSALPAGERGGTSDAGAGRVYVFTPNTRG